MTGLKKEWGRPSGRPPSARTLALCLLVLLISSAGCKDFLTGGKKHQWLLWQVPVISGDWTVPAVDSKWLFMYADSGMAAFEQETGRLVWMPRQLGGGGAFNIIHQNGRLFAAEVEVVRSWDAATGAVLWEWFPYQTFTNFAQSTVDEQAMYVGTRNHRVLALGIDDGQILWDVDVGPDWSHLAPVSGLSVSGDTVYAGIRRDLNPNGFDAAAVIVALDRHTGRELWRYQSAGTKSNIIGAPIVAGRLLVANSSYHNSTFAVDRFTGQEIWRTEGRPGFVGPGAEPHIAGDVVYVGSGDTHVYALDLATGRVRWATKTAGSILAIGVCGDRIVVNNYNIEVIDRHSGKHLGVAFRSTSSEFASSGVAIANERAFVAGSRKLYAVRCD
jgi:outer membrane protein assembly factor BamB